jgi:hypothetical protein
MKMLQLAISVCLFVAGLQPCLFGQSTPSAAAPCEAGHRIITPKNPARTSDGNISAGQSIMQAQMAVGQSATVRVVEHPRSGKDLDAYNSTVIVQNGPEKRSYPLKDLIKDGEFFRLVETARLCSSADAGTVFLAFETPSTGASEGFAVVQYSPQGITVRGLPVADEGRIVVQSPTEVEVWTAQGGEGLGGIECDACKKQYAIMTCHLGQDGVHCSGPTKTAGAVSPDKFMRARIKVR